MTAAFTLSDVNKVYGSREVLNVRHLEVHHNYCYTILGPNGSGKTTLLRIMGLLLVNDGGKINVLGEKITWEKSQLLRLRRQMAMVTQSSYMFLGSVYYNLAYGLKVRGNSGTCINQKVDEVLEIVGMSEFKQADAHSLSGGERQKIAIARALTVKPRVLFLDEPTTNIDNKSIIEIEKHIKEINTTFKTTIIMVTHNLFQARRLSDKLIMMWDGKIIEEGGPALFEEARDARTRAFLSGQLVPTMI